MDMEDFNKRHWCPKCQAQNFVSSQTIVSMQGEESTTHVQCRACDAEFHIKLTPKYVRLSSQRTRILWSAAVWLAVWLFVDYMQVAVIYPVLLLIGYAVSGITMPFPSVLNPKQYQLFKVTH